MPDFKTIADFRKDNGPAIRATCRQFVMLCRLADGWIVLCNHPAKAVMRDCQAAAAEISSFFECQGSGSSSREAG
jgi:hypothetical protein